MKESHIKSKINRGVHLEHLEGLYMAVGQNLMELLHVLVLKSIDF